MPITPKAAPQTIAPPPPKEEEKLPRLEDIISNRKDRIELIRILDQERAFAQQELEAKKARRPLTNKIKNILGTYHVSRASWLDWDINYYSIPRTTLDQKDLRAALLTVGLTTDQIRGVFAACTKVSESYTLRIRQHGEAEEEF
jgi:hypothetical protein